MLIKVTCLHPGVPLQIFVRVCVPVVVGTVVIAAVVGMVVLETAVNLVVAEVMVDGIVVVEPVVVENVATITELPAI